MIVIPTQVARQLAALRAEDLRREADAHRLAMHAAARRVTGDEPASPPPERPGRAPMRLALRLRLLRGAA
ncbi:MAG: hypothetical protein KDC36_00915 [Thermoleophilia bacterium]|nr:hypothetical protein [Thermoleophilia bacterium]